jgi:hypothetical protein
MPDLDETTLFGEAQQDEAVPWPHGYGNTPADLERTLFGEISFWTYFRWPEGHGPTP